MRLSICFVLLLGITSGARAQQPASAETTTDRATIQALLAEVRQLRMAIERSTSILPRINLAAQRYQMQQDRVDRLSRELRDVQNQASQQAAERDRLAGTLKRIEADSSEARDPAQRKEFEEAKRQLTFEIEQVAARERARQAQEIELLSQLQTERTNLSFFSDQLNALDKALQQQQPQPGMNAR
jgi:hypothetical protein